MKKKTIIAVVAVLLCLRACGGAPAKKQKPATVRPAAPETTAPPTEAPALPEPTVPPTEAPAQPAPSTRAGIRPEFQAAMDSYEAFYNEYCDLLQEYTKNPSDFSLLGKYAGMLTKAAEMDKKFEAWDEGEMSNEELKYYLDVTARIQKRMIDLF